MQPQEPTQHEQAKKVAIVEDNRQLAEVYKTKLEMAGYQCLVANDGIAALYLIQKELPDLVLLDLMVPNIAGDQILARMRSSDWGKDIPVVIISNLNEKDAPANIRGYGISGYVVKASLSLDEFGNLVKSMLTSGHLPDNVVQDTPPSEPAQPGHQPQL